MLGVRSVFARDSYETFTGLLADGDRTSAREMVSFLFDRVQQPDGTFPRDSLVDGEVAPDTYGLYEVDEDASRLTRAAEVQSRVCGLAVKCPRPARMAPIGSHRTRC